MACGALLAAVANKSLMKKILVAVVAGSLLFALNMGRAATTNDVTTEVQSLVSKIQTKLKAGQSSAQDLAPEIKGFDDLIAQHKSEKTDDVAKALYTEAMVYGQVLNDETKADQLIAQLKRDFKDTQLVQRLEQQEKKQAEAEKTQATLKPGAKFPDFQEKDLDGKALSISNYKGKVVLIDFWATWCGPCRAELPNVLKAYEKYHAKGFEIIGVSLDEDKTKLTDFIKQKGMTWAQYFDGEGWSNKLAGQYGIQSIPATYLLDGQGNIIARDLRGEALDDAIATALAKK